MGLIRGPSILWSYLPVTVDGLSRVLLNMFQRKGGRGKEEGFHPSSMLAAALGP